MKSEIKEQRSPISFENLRTTKASLKFTCSHKQKSVYVNVVTGKFVVWANMLLKLCEGLICRVNLAQKQDQPGINLIVRKPYIF